MPRQPELLPPDAPRWAVITIHRRQTREQRLRKEPPETAYHELCWGAQPQTRRRGEHGLEILREMARFLNSRNLAPRPRIQCAADSDNPAAYLKKLPYQSTTTTTNPA